MRSFRSAGCQERKLRVAGSAWICFFGGGTTVRDVGFTVVLESANRWLVNVIEVTKVTGVE